MAKLINVADADQADQSVMDPLAPDAPLEPIEASDDATDIGEVENAEDSRAARELATVIAQAADDRKAENIRILAVSGISYLADYFVIASGFSKVQVRAIARSVEAVVKENYGRHPIRTEGLGDGQWVLYDYGEVIVHIFMPREREFYDLEAFWGHAQEVPFTPSQTLAQSPIFGAE
ncbi:MAG: ribosome silencing factor [Cyanobacteria bacterium P01_A01_bin.105]